MRFFKNLAVTGRTGLWQPEVSKLAHELRQLTNLVSTQPTKGLNIADATINYWGNGHSQLPLLAAEQLCRLTEQLNQSSAKVLRSGRQQPLTQHFLQEG